MVLPGSDLAIIAALLAGLVGTTTMTISSASEAVARGGFTLGQLATLGGWSSADACRRYVRTIVVGAS